jgi:hypothetical protein
MHLKSARVHARMNVFESSFFMQILHPTAAGDSTYIRSAVADRSLTTIA